MQVRTSWPIRVGLIIAKFRIDFSIHAQLLSLYGLGNVGIPSSASSPLDNFQWTPNSDIKEITQEAKS